MEKYDRDVEQKQHELDVLKVCISYFMLVSKRNARALSTLPHPPSRSLCSQLTISELTQASFPKRGEKRSYWYENEFLFSCK